MFVPIVAMRQPTAGPIASLIVTSLFATCWRASLRSLPGQTCKSGRNLRSFDNGSKGSKTQQGNCCGILEYQLTSNRASRQAILSEAGSGVFSGIKLTTSWKSSLLICILAVVKAQIRTIHTAGVKKVIGACLKSMPQEHASRDSLRRTTRHISGMFVELLVTHRPVHSQCVTHVDCKPGEELWRHVFL